MKLCTNINKVKHSSVCLFAYKEKQQSRALQEDMATASPFLSEDQFLCSICLDVYTEPVSIPCGHNFCKACITRHWEGKEQCHCPLCNEKLNKGLKLRVNTGFREVVENFKKHHAIADSNSPVKPGQVPCDCCLGNKFKASKTCLVCLTSYCETHLEPHKRVDSLKRHKLTNPVQNLDDKICKKHYRILELFCRNDLTRICVLCTEHSAHDTVPLEEAYVDKRAQMGKKKAEAQEIKQKRGKKAQKTKRKGKNEAMANSVVSDQMQAPHIWWFPSEDPHQFNRCFYVPGNMVFSEGKFYYELQAEARTGWDLRVVRESVCRKRTFTPNPRNRNWIIRKGNDTICKALYDVPVHLFLTRKPERVIVFVDYDNGLVSFYDADTETLIYSFTGCKFNERIFLFFSPSPTEDVNLAQRLQKKVQKMKIWSQLSDAFYCFIFMVILISIWQS
ncbi:zinc-binding protein A33-like [Siniperca chuatsi]|uniref:zinc-binding protein A33-like n=1 Tax=Siniperca chuatsi TaxID=119488 RepID=UPI001CE0B640|nr:zinc-binding protein A33-like [Siniperca chuatsi]